jgi:predicted CXXCH cytochrome family protein
MEMLAQRSMTHPALFVVVFLIGCGLTGVPSATADSAQEVHSPSNRQACTVCHLEEPDAEAVGDQTPPLRRETIHELCSECHKWKAGHDHPVGIPISRLSDVSGSLPTDEGGLMDCLTCHKPHGSGPHKAMLRLEPKKLCQACHADK